MGSSEWRTVGMALCRPGRLARWSLSSPPPSPSPPSPSPSSPSPPSPSLLSHPLVCACEFFSFHPMGRLLASLVWASVAVTASGLRQAPQNRRSALTKSSQALAFLMALPSKATGEAGASTMLAPDNVPAVMKAVTRGSAGVFSFDDSYATPKCSPKEVLVGIKASHRHQRQGRFRVSEAARC